MKFKLKYKYEFKWEDVGYWANKKPTSETRREASKEYLVRWSKIGKSNSEDENETFSEKVYKKCKLCSYTCKKRITLMQHVNTKHGHGHGEPERFSKVDNIQNK